MICCNSAFEQGNLDLWRYINAFIIIIIFMIIITCFCDIIELRVESDLRYASRQPVIIAAI